MLRYIKGPQNYSVETTDEIEALKNAINQHQKQSNAYAITLFISILYAFSGAITNSGNISNYTILGININENIFYITIALMIIASSYVYTNIRIKSMSAQYLYYYLIKERIEIENRNNSNTDIDDNNNRNINSNILIIQPITAIGQYNYTFAYTIKDFYFLIKHFSFGETSTVKTIYRIKDKRELIEISNNKIGETIYNIFKDVWIRKSVLVLYLPSIISIIFVVVGICNIFTNKNTMEVSILIKSGVLFSFWLILLILHFWVSRAAWIMILAWDKPKAE